MYNEKESRYEIKLLYLGKYLKDIETDKNLFLNEIKIPESEYKNQLSEFGLIKKEKIQKINTEILYNSYKKYEKEINKIELNKDIQIINSFENSKRENSKINLENESKYENEKEIIENMIIGEIDIKNKNEINKDIQIINSFENFKRENSNINLEDESKYENEKEIKENIEITIDGKYIDFSYNYKFRRRKS